MQEFFPFAGKFDILDKFGGREKWGIAWGSKEKSKELCVFPFSSRFPLPSPLYFYKLKW